MNGAGEKQRGEAEARTPMAGEGKKTLGLPCWGKKRRSMRASIRQGEGMDQGTRPGVGLCSQCSTKGQQVDACDRGYPSPRCQVSECLLQRCLPSGQQEIGWLV